MDSKSRWRVAATLAMATCAGLAACEKPFLHDLPTRAPSIDDGACPPPTGAATDLANVSGSSGVGLAWQDNALDEDGFIIERSSSLEPTWGELIRLGAGAVNFTDPQVERDTQYSYRVVAYRVIGNQTCRATETPEISAVTSPLPVLELEGALVTSTSIALTWLDQAAWEAGYRIERRKDGEVENVVLAEIEADAVVYTDATMEDGTGYVYRVIAFNAGGDSEAVTLEARSASMPSVAWGDAPSFDAACVLSVPVTADADSEVGAALASASGTVDKGDAAVLVAATVEGMSKDLAGLANHGPGKFATSYTIVDSLGGETTISRDLEITKTTLTLRAPLEALPGAATLINAGLQELMPTCSECAGERASIAVGSTFTCFVNASRGVSCFGSNNAYQLGDGSVARAIHATRACEIDGAGTCIATITDFVQVVSGEGFSCGRTSSGAVSCWGHNSDGQLGRGVSGAYGDANPVPMPVCVSGSGATCVELGGATQLTAGGSHACAVVAGGEVRCWGSGYYGQLGDGTYGDGDYVRLNATPVCATGSTDAACVALTGVTQLAAGPYNTCAVVAGEAWCWGYNYYGQLGNGVDYSTLDYAVNPVPVCASGSGGACPRLASLAEVTLGDYFACARSTIGEVHCWGYNYDGQLGNDDAGTDSLLPVAVCAAAGPACATLTGATGLDAARDHACAVLNTGELVCWGVNGSGQLGRDTSGNDQDYAQPVLCAAGAACTNLGGVAAVSASEDATCARMASGGVQCFGDNADGQLGDGTRTERFAPSPTCVSGVAANCAALASATQLDVGPSHACAIAAGELVCWGSNTLGQLALPDRDEAGTPVTVVDGIGATGAPLANVASVVAGFAHACALLDSGRVVCWGAGSYGQLGRGDTSASGYAGDVCHDTGAGCVPLTGVVSIAAGFAHTCVVRSQGDVWCWGMSDDGQLGQGVGAPAYESKPKPVCLSGSVTGCEPLVAGARAVASGYTHTCILMLDGTTLCMGANDHGQLGDGTTTLRRNPARVCATGDGSDCVALRGLTRLALAGAHSCALDAAGRAYCWGSNEMGQLANGALDSDQCLNGDVRPSILVPRAVCSTGTGPTCAPLADVATVAVAGSSDRGFSCFLLRDGTVRCAGDTFFGQQGDGTTFGCGRSTLRAVCADVVEAAACDSASSPPACTTPLGNAVAISALDSHTCAVSSDGSIDCWGYGLDAQLGQGVDDENNCTAQQVCASGDGSACTGGSAVASASHRVCDVYSVGVAP